MKRRVLMKVALSLGVVFAAMAQAGEVTVVHRGGYSLHVEQHGHGPTVVVFEAGFGQGPDVWKGIIANLDEECQCITYARAGLGKSGTDGKPKTIEEHVQDLKAVIDAVAPDQKVVLVGHSYGGLLATKFARAHPVRLQGLVLVDPTTMGQRNAFEQADRDRVFADDKTLLAMLPPNLGKQYKLLTAQMDSYVAGSSHSLPDVPVALLTSTEVAAEPFVFEETAQGKDIWKQQHAELFAKSSRGIHKYYATGHNIHREKPKGVADAIRFVIVTSRARH